MAPRRASALPVRFRDSEDEGANPTSPGDTPRTPPTGRPSEGPDGERPPTVQGQSRANSIIERVVNLIEQGSTLSSNRVIACQQAFNYVETALEELIILDSLRLVHKLPWPTLRAKLLEANASLKSRNNTSLDSMLEFLARGLPL